MRRLALAAALCLTPAVALAQSGADPSGRSGSSQPDATRSDTAQPDMPESDMAKAAGDRATATAQLQDAKGGDVGTVTLTQYKGGVVLRGDLKNLPGGGGWHAIHVHENGTCTPDFKAAGGHFNPTDVGHGLDEGDMAHAGDLPNFHAGEDGTAMFEMMTTRLSLSDDAEVAVSGVQGAPTVFDENGSAIVIHAKADDYATDPAGDSGDRIACGVIEK